MSTEHDTVELANDDMALLEMLEDDAQETGQDCEFLKQQNRELRAEVDELQDGLAECRETIQALTGMVNDLQARVNGQDPTDPRSSSYYEDLTILEKYRRMSEAEQEQLLAGNPSKRRAITIFEHWREWAEQVPAGWLISTNQTHGKHGRTAIAVYLQSATGEDLQANEVYRAMKTVAKLSVKDSDDVEVVTDNYGREHITGGAFEYHEKVNPNANGTNRKHKILKLVDEDGVMIP